MTIEGNPKVMAMDVANGFLNITQATLKKYNEADLKKIVNALTVVLRELRGTTVDNNDALQIKKKNQQMSRINQAMMIIRSYAKIRRMVI